MEVPWVGRHPVNVGASLARSLKARKGAPVKQSKHLPVHDFYLFRYNFKPESVDTTKPGTVESTSTGEASSNVRVERASVQPDEVHIFRGKEEEAKEFECVLIYNEADKMFTLEKLDSSVMLVHERKAAKSRPLPTSTVTTPSPPTAPQPQEDEEDIEAQLDRELNSAIQEIDDEFEELVPDSAPASSFRGISNSTKDEEEIPLSKQKSRAKSITRIKDMPPSKQPDPLSQMTLSATPPLAKGKTKRMQEFADEENLIFGQPAKAVKRARPSIPQQPSGGGFALPGSGSAFAHLPSAPATSQSVEPPQPVEPELPAGQDDSDSEEEWDDVIQPVSQPLQVDVDHSIFGDDDDGGEDMGFDHQLEALMYEQLNEVEDADGDGDGEEIEHGDLFNSATETNTQGGPVSMNAIAGGQVVDYDDDDDYSSSDDSDDD